MNAIDYKEIYILAPKTTGYRIEFNVTAFQKPGLYTIGYTVSEVEPSAGGGLPIRLKVNKNFKLRVIEDPNRRVTESSNRIVIEGPNRFRIGYFILAFVAWYFYFGAECFLNGADSWDFFMPFKCYWQEILWNIPGGQQRRIEWMKEWVKAPQHGTMLGKTKSWNYEEVRAGNLYAECVSDMLPGKFHCFLVIAVPIGLAFGFGIIVEKLLPVFN